MHYYQFNIGDYIKHTMHLTSEEDLAYRRLLDMYYDTEQPIPTGIPLVSRRLRMASEIVESVLNEFFELSPEGYRNLRADAEIAEYHTFLEKQRTNGKLGGRPKKTQRKPTANPTITQTEPKKSLNTPNKQETLPITKEEKETPAKFGRVDKPFGVSGQTWDDYLQTRKAKKSPITESALAGIEKEARKAGWTLEKALIECCARGWAGFKAEWVLKDQPKKTQHQLNNEAMARSIGLIPHEDNYQNNEGIIYDAEPITPRLG